MSVNGAKESPSKAKGSFIFRPWSVLPALDVPIPRIVFWAGRICRIALAIKSIDAFYKVP